MTPTLNVRRVAPGGRSGRHLSRLLRVAACVVAAGASAGVGVYTSAESLPRATRATVLDGVRSNELGERAAKSAMLAAVPALTVTGICGTSGVPTMGQFMWRIDPDTATTGGGRWDEGYFEWRVRIDGATPSTRISCTDPVDGATTRYLDCDQHAAVFAYLAQDAGDHVAEVRFRNAYGLWSEWKACSAVTVTTRSGSECFVDGARADDTGDGLSWATAKKTFQAGATLLDTLGDGATMWVRDCACSSSTVIDTAKNVLIAKDPSAGSATVTVSGNVNVVRGQTGMDGCVMSGLTFTGTGRAFNFTASNTCKNACLYNCTFGSISDWATAQTAAVVQGFSHINCTETASVSDQQYFSDNTEGFVAFGVSAPLGSLNEHSYRLTSGGANPNSAYHSFQYCDLGCATNKTPLRWLASVHLWAHGCVMRRTVYVGFTSPGDTAATGGTTWNFTRCKFVRYSGQASDFSFTIFSGWFEGTVSNCYFNNISINFSPRNDETGDHAVTNTTIINNTFDGGLSIIGYGTTLTSNPTNQVIKNNTWIADGMATTSGFIRVKNLTTTTGWVFEGNRFDRSSDTHVILRDHGTATDYNWTNYSALGFVSGGSRGTTTINTTTLEPDGGLTDGVVSYPMPHVSYNGVRYDRLAASYPAGAWLDEADEETEYDIFTTATTHTWVAPFTGEVLVKATGAGGGGGSKGNATAGGAGGGGGGEYQEGLVSVTEGESYTVTVGAGGTTFSGDLAGTAGGDSSFVGDDSETVEASGGSGGSGGAGGAGGAGGTGGTGTTGNNGGAGGSGHATTANGGGGGEGADDSAVGGTGGNGTTSDPGAGGTGGGGGDGGTGGDNDDGLDGTAPGGGGGGGATSSITARRGGDGGDGQVILEFVPAAAAVELTLRDSSGDDFDPVVLDDGSVDAGTFVEGATETHTYRIYNTEEQTVTLDLDTLAITGDGSDANPGTGTVELETGEYHEVQITYDTATAGTGLSAALSVDHDQTGSPFAVTFSFDVDAVELTLRDSSGNDFDPVALDGASVAFGTFTKGQSVTRTPRIYNTGDVSLTLSTGGQSITGDATFNEFITPPATTVVASGSFTTTNQIIFDTSTVGSKSFDYSVAHTGFDTPFNFTGTFDVVDYELTLRDSNGINFNPFATDGETVAVGTFIKDSDGTRVFRITNTGDSTITLDIDTLAVTGDATDADPGSGTVALASGEYHEVTLEFDTSATGTGLTADMTVDHDATGSPFNITFTFDVEEEDPEPEPGDDGTSRVFRLGRHGRQTRV